MAVCTGCSLLCEDIEVEFEAGKVVRTKNLCRKGLGRYRSLYSERISPRVGGQASTLDEALEAAAKILSGAKRPLLFGWSNSTLEAQAVGIRLARKLGAVVDDTSSFCQGIILEKVLRGVLPTCTLDDVRNYADKIVFWGCDPSSSHPRHLSRFSYFPRGEKRQKGYEEDRTGFVVDVRKSPTAEIVDEGFFKVLPGGDADLIRAFLTVMDGKIPRVEDKKRVLATVATLKKAQFGVIFPGLGLVYSMKEEMGLFEELVTRLNEAGRYSVIPMVGHYNMRGFNQTLLDEVGEINRVSFAGGEVAHGPEYGVLEASKECDAVVVIGSDPLSSLPAGVARRLAGVPLITIDPHRTLTSEVAEVVIPSAVSGLEAGGSAIRMDGVQVEFSPIVDGEAPSDLEVLTRMEEAV